MKALLDPSNRPQLVAAAAVAALVAGTLSAAGFRASRKKSPEEEIAHAFATYTAMDDLDALPSRPRNKIPGTAVVVGGSIIGILTARVCADHFERVVVVEADAGADLAYPAAEDHHQQQQQSNGHANGHGTQVKRDQHGNRTITSRRPRVLQEFQVHGYQPLTLLALRRLVPDFDEKFKSLGGRICDFSFNPVWSGVELRRPTPSKFSRGANLPYHRNLEGLYTRFYKDDGAKAGEGGYPIPDSIFCTRANLEVWIRKMVLETCPQIELVKGTVTGLEKGTLTSIDRVVYRPLDGRTTERISANLVVDCTGLSKAGVKWLEHLGYDTIPQDTYDPQLRYMTFWFDLSKAEYDNLPVPQHFKEDEFFTFSWEDSSLGGKALWVFKGEGNTLGVAYGGFGITSAEIPRTPEKVKEFYSTMKRWDDKPMDPWFLDLIDYLAKDGGWKDAKCEETRAPPSVLVKYHDVPANTLPTNFIAIGDSVMRTSPVYGFGITKGVCGVITLAGSLDAITRPRLWRIGSPSLPKSFADSFMQRQHTRTAWSWKQSKDADYGFDTTIPCEGETLEEGAMMRALVTEMLHLTTTDDDAAGTPLFARVWMYPETTEMFLRAFGKAGAQLQAKMEAANNPKTAA